MADVLRVLSPTAILGYGFPESSFQRGLEMEPDLLAVDAGSTDPGPYYLGAGKSFTDRTAVKRDLTLMLKAARAKKIPLVIGSAGGSGANTHLEWNVEILREIGRENNLSFRMGIIYSEIGKGRLLEYKEAGKVALLDGYGSLDNYTKEVEDSVRVVGQMGVEPIIEALAGGAEVIVAGRVYDPTAFAALGILRGFEPGLALHMGKILECAAIAADPGSGSDCMLGTLGRDSFILEPLNPERRCTTTSVAAHTLYEKSNPFKLYGPGGIIDLAKTSFQQLDDRRVKVQGSRFLPTDPYTIKLEGAHLVGYRTLSIAGTRDPMMISQIEEITEVVRKAVNENFTEICPEQFTLIFRLYGQNGVMGSLEPTPTPGHELGIIIEVVAESQELANTICSFARSTMLHYGYDQRVATAGNLAFPYSPSDIEAGEVYEFSLNYLLEVSDPLELCQIEYEDLSYSLRGGF